MGLDLFRGVIGHSSGPGPAQLANRSRAADPWR